MVVAMGAMTPVIASPSTHSIASNTITATGMNSASGGYYKCTGTFYNYCPICHHWEVMEWNPKHTAEGEWTCAHCGADFSINGHCKAYHSKYWLVKA
jgi:hypothetical protein